MTDPLVSVIVPVCNVEGFLDQCLFSIERQTLASLEIICINDGSTDNSLAIMRKHETADKRYVVIDKENEGYGATCNRGLELARGEWIAIIEPDDWIAPTMFEDMVSFAGSFQERIEIVKTPWVEVYNWDNPQRETRSACRLQSRMSTSTRPFSLEERPLLIETHPAIWSALYRRSFLNECGLRFRSYPGAGWADNPFLIETLMHAHAIVYLNRAYYCYRCELPKPNGWRPSDERITMPFERWNTMLSTLLDLGASDSLLMAHYLRGFNYVSQAIDEAGWKHPLVQKKTKEMFARMDDSLVAKHPKLSGKRKAFFFEVKGEKRPAVFVPERACYLIEEIAARVKERLNPTAFS